MSQPHYLQASHSTPSHKPLPPNATLPQVLNMSHIIRHLGFGPHYPGQSNPLDGYVRIVDRRPHSYKYFLKVVPTEYYGRLGE